MRSRRLLLLLGVGALLLTPGASGSRSVPGDPTPPVVTPLIFGTLGANGWYVSNVTVNWRIEDPESIILSTTGCDARTMTADTVGIRLTCSAASDGGETTVAITIRRDTTPPTASADPSRPPDSNGWYNHALTVNFTGTDATSGVDICSAQQSYSGPDSASASVSGSCRDVAGNTAPRSFGLKYDATAPLVTGRSPARPPDANGWYNHALTVTYQGSDATSGIDACSQPSYAGPDSASASVSGTCRDRAGNQSGSSVFALKYDATGPQVSATPARAPDANGWYNHLLTVSFAGTDVTSGIDVCAAPQSYSGPDSASTSVSGSCRDVAGNTTPRSLGLKYDATAPQVNATPARPADANGWYNRALTVSFAGTDATSGVDVCTVPQSYSGPDSASASVSGFCRDLAGNSTGLSFGLKYDATAPLVTGRSPSRPPDANGWYNHTLTVTFQGSDATSGVDVCTQPSYAGPDSASAAVSGSCSDRAGNQSGSSMSSVFALKYDATTPQVTATPARAADANGWYNRALTVSFAGTDATSGIDVCVAPQSYSGPDSASASVSGSCRDLAGNTTPRSFGLKYDATAPQASASPSRTPDANGWYNRALTVSFVGTDATSGVDVCTVPTTYAGPDSPSASVGGSCVDKAGNLGPTSLSLKYDATGPQVTAAPGRAADANGWYNRALTVSFAGIDATSGIDVCTAPKTYAGPDSPSASVGGSCLDKAANLGLASLPLKYDATAPQVSASPARTADANGWYNRPLAVSFAGTDATSGIDVCAAPQSYSGPDSASAEVGGSCQDKAANVGVASFQLKYDATAPQVSPSPSRTPDTNGWYNHALTVSFAGADGASGVDVCTAPKTYAGPDSSSASVGGSCLDKAANLGLGSLPLKYDATAPQVTGASPARAPDANGWHNHPVTINFQGSDATSGIDGCTEVSYAGPDNAAASVNGSCRDRAGNQSGSSAFGLKYDATAPQVTSAIAVRPPDRAGWYHRPVVFAFEGSDGISGIDMCPPTTYEGPDGADASVAGSCLDLAGNRGVRSFPLNYDATGPQVGVGAGRGPDANGWYNHPLLVTFSGSDTISGLDSCSPAQRYEGPDSTFAAVGGSCLDKAGNVGLGSLPLKYDATAPQVSGASPARAPDANGWYNHPLAISFHGGDATSGIDACTEASYTGPDNAAASVSGSCRDRAANESGSSAFVLKYDATAPSLTGVTVKAGNRTAVLRWRASPDTTLIEIVRSSGTRSRATPVYRGAGESFTDTGLRNGVKYRYEISAYDAARNASEGSVVALPRAPLYGPPLGARVASPPLLVWTPVENAAYYNVQLWRGRRILSAWPSRPSLRLRRSWTYGGRRYRLTPGRYRWYVWPGFGGRAAKNYGRLLGGSSFVVTAGKR